MKKLIIQMDAPESFNPVTDSTLMLALEAQKRGYELHFYTPSQLASVSGEVIAQTRPITFFDRTENFFEYGEVAAMNLEQADVILIRQNPPYNMEYLGCTWMLERLKNPKILNNPTNIRNRPEKIFPLEFPDYIPPTCISADMATLTAFREEHKNIVLKPLYGYGGLSIFHIKPDSHNFKPLLELMLAESPEPVILQPYLPEVMTGEKRIILINGEIAGSFNRIPSEGEIRVNTSRGGGYAPTELSPRQRELSQKIGAICKNENLMLIGLDVIGDYLIEINTTCPTGLRVMQELYDEDLTVTFWDAVEAL